MHTMFKVSREHFEALVEDGIRAIPEQFREQMRNLVIVAEAFPTKEQLQENGIEEDDDLLGLFEGLMAGEQGSGPWELPSKISIFQRASEEEAETGEELAEIVTETVWHEVAHYFGMEEDEVRTSEERRRENRNHRHGS